VTQTTDESHTPVQATLLPQEYIGGQTTKNTAPTTVPGLATTVLDPQSDAPTQTRAPAQLLMVAQAYVVVPHEARMATHTSLLSQRNCATRQALVLAVQ
jgi:hypothetical protein